LIAAEQLTLLSPQLAAKAGTRVSLPPEQRHPFVSEFPSDANPLPAKSCRCDFPWPDTREEPPRCCKCGHAVGERTP
jgi:hypothetical protein